MTKLKKGLAFTLTLTMIALSAFYLPDTAQTVKAATTSYVTGITLIAGSKDTIKDDFASGTIKLGEDFNCKAGGKYIFGGYTTSTDASKAIHGLVFSGEKKSSITYQGCTYKPINTIGDSDGDFNQGKKDSDDIYLYYTTDENAGPAITSLLAYCDSHRKYVDKPRVRNVNGKVQDLNAGAGGSDLYLGYSAEVNTSAAEVTCNLYAANIEEIPSGSKLFLTQLTQERTLQNWIAVANAIGSANETDDKNNYIFNGSYSLIDVTSPYAAAKAINEDFADEFSQTASTTFYIKDGDNGILFTNFNYADSNSYLTTSVDTDVKIGAGLDTLKRKGIKVSQGIAEFTSAETLENLTSSDAVLKSSYSSTSGTQYCTETSQTKSNDLSTSTQATVSQSYTIPFVGEGSVSVTQMIGLNISTSTTKTTSDWITAESTSSSEVEINVPAHTTCQVFKQVYNGDVTLNYTNAVIASYDVYIIKGDVFYHFTGTSGGANAYSSATKNLYYRAITRPADGYSTDIAIESNNEKEGLVDWKQVIEDHPTARRAIYELNRNVFVAPYGGTLTYRCTQTRYIADSYQPLYKLKAITPQTSNVNLDSSETLNLDKIKLNATDKDGVAWYGFDAREDGQWKVLEGPATITTNASGSTVLNPTGTGEVSLQYVANQIEADKKESNFSSKLLTVNVTCNNHQAKNTVKKATINKDGSITTTCSKCGQTLSTKKIASPEKLTLSKTSYTYNGKVQKPSVVVKDRKGKTISPSNYTLTYTQSKDVGTYKVKATLKGNYSGSLTGTYTIQPAATTMKTPIAGKKAFTAKWSKQSTKMSKARISAYEVQYSTSSKFKNAKTKAVNGYTKTSLKISSLKAKTTYYVRVRTKMKISGKTYTSSWSKAKKVKTK